MRTAKRFPREAGFSLVELLVAMGIGLMLLTVLATVFANSSRTQKEITLAAQQVENGRYALEVLSDDLRHAGFYGPYYSLPAPPGTLTDPCSVSLTDIRAGLAFPIQGYDSPASSPLSCIDDDNFVPRTDILVVRRASTVTAGTLSDDVVYIQATASPNNANNPVVDLGSNASSFNLTIRNGTGSNVTAPVRKLETHIYFIAPCSNPTGSGGTKCTTSDDGGTPIPTLKRLELTADASGTKFEVYPLVEGVENLQIEYGVDTDGDGGPNSSFVTEPASVADWQRVMAAHVYVLARNTQPSPGYVDNKSYVLGGTTIAAPGDNYRRHLYTAVVRLKNPSERLDTP